jgi:hypothetical protein
MGPGQLQPCADEVARVFWIDLAHWVYGDRILAIAWPPETGFSPSPVFESGGLEGTLMYGGTAYVLYELLQVMAALAGRSLPPWDVSRWTWDGKANRPMKRAGAR